MLDDTNMGFHVVRNSPSPVLARFKALKFGIGDVGSALSRVASRHLA